MTMLATNVNEVRMLCYVETCVYLSSRLGIGSHIIGTQLQVEHMSKSHSINGLRYLTFEWRFVCCVDVEYLVRLFVSEGQCSSQINL